MWKLSRTVTKIQALRAQHKIVRRVSEATGSWTAAMGAGKYTLPAQKPAKVRSSLPKTWNFKWTKVDRTKRKHQKSRGGDFFPWFCLNFPVSPEYYTFQADTGNNLMPPLVPGEGNLLKTDSCTSQETKVLFPVCTVTLLFNICAVSGPPLPHFLSLTFFQSVLTRNILKLQNTISYMLVLLLQNKRWSATHNVCLYRKLWKIWTCRLFPNMILAHLKLFSIRRVRAK